PTRATNWRQPAPMRSPGPGEAVARLRLAPPGGTLRGEPGRGAAPHVGWSAPARRRELARPASGPRADAPIPRLSVAFTDARQSRRWRTGGHRARAGRDRNHGV